MVLMHHNPCGAAFNATCFNSRGTQSVYLCITQGLSGLLFPVIMLVASHRE
jgi:hypothetical protein